MRSAVTCSSARSSIPRSSAARPGGEHSAEDIPRRRPEDGRRAAPHRGQPARKAQQAPARESRYPPGHPPPASGQPALAVGQARSDRRAVPCAALPSSTRRPGDNAASEAAVVFPAGGRRYLRSRSARRPQTATRSAPIPYRAWKAANPPVPAPENALRPPRGHGRAVRQGPRDSTVPPPVAAPP